MAQITTVDNLLAECKWFLTSPAPSTPSFIRKFILSKKKVNSGDHRRLKTMYFLLKVCVLFDFIFLTATKNIEI